MTCLEKLLKEFPNTPLGQREGVGKGSPCFCPSDIGMAESGCANYENCLDCWNQPFIPMMHKYSIVYKFSLPGVDEHSATQTVTSYSKGRAEDLFYMNSPEGFEEVINIIQLD